MKTRKCEQLFHELKELNPARLDGWHLCEILEAAGLVTVIERTPDGRPLRYAEMPTLWNAPTGAVRNSLIEHALTNYKIPRGTK